MRVDVSMKAIGGIERKLIRLYSDVLDEPIPRALQDLLTELEQVEPGYPKPHSKSIRKEQDPEKKESP